MARYIDVEKVHIPKGFFKDLNVPKLLDWLKSQPTADVVEVKHGYWQDKFNRNRMVSQSFCSVCGKHSGIGGIESNRHKPYCPNCGAKMDGERKCDK